MDVWQVKVAYCCGEFLFIEDDVPHGAQCTRLANVHTSHIPADHPWDPPTCPFYMEYGVVFDHISP